MIICYDCGKELYETDDNKPYEWVVINGYIYCWDCYNDN